MWVRTTGETSCGAQNQSSIGIEPFYHEPDETQNLPGDGQTGGMEQLAIRVRGSGYLDQSHHECYSNEPDASQSCFSSDSSIDSTDFSKPEVDVTAARTRPTALSWWRPKRNYDEIHEDTRAASIPNFQEYSVGLWKRISKKTSNHLRNKNPKDEVDRKLQAKLSKVEHSSLRASHMSEGSVNRDSHCHLAHRKQTAAPNVQSGFSTSSHIFSVMKPLNSPCASQSMANNTTKSQRGSRNSPAMLTKSRPSSSTHSTKVAPQGIHPVHRPYKPSPLKHFTRVKSLDVNKELPPLPPEARRLAHQASKGTLREVAAVRKVAIRNVVHEYVDEMARAY